MGVVSVLGGGFVHYSPELNLWVLDSFAYVMSDDGGLLSDSVWVYVNVVGVSDGPLAYGDRDTTLRT